MGNNNRTDIGFNDIFIGHTTICEAARLISNSEPEIASSFISLSSGNAQLKRFLRFLELCSLIEAVVLHDKLYTLPAELPSDIDNLKLRQNLIVSGILREYTSSELSKEIIPGLTEWIVRNAKQLSRELGTYDFSNSDEDIPRITLILSKMIDRDSSSRHLVKQDNLNYPSQDTYEVNRIGEISKLFEVESVLAENLYSGIFLNNNSVLNDISRQLGFNISNFGGSFYETALPMLRTLIYWQVADKTRLPWYPDVIRVPTMVTLNRRLKLSLADHVYSAVAQAFECKTKDLINEDLSYEVAIPPLAALLLSRCSKPEDIIDQLFILRDEFTDFRQNFSELEQQRRNAESINEHKKIKLQIQNLFRAVASRYDRPDQSHFETAIGYAPEVIDLLNNPLSPEKYAGEILKKPYEWIRDWWCGRPASRLFSVTNKLEQLKLYGQIVPQIFGFEITSSNAAFIREHYSKMRSFTDPI